MRVDGQRHHCLPVKMATRACFATLCFMLFVTALTAPLLTAAAATALQQPAVPDALAAPPTTQQQQQQHSALPERLLDFSDFFDAVDRQQFFQSVYQQDTFVAHQTPRVFSDAMLSTIEPMVDLQALCRSFEDQPNKHGGFQVCVCVRMCVCVCVSLPACVALAVEQQTPLKQHGHLPRTEWSGSQTGAAPTAAAPAVAQDAPRNDQA